MGDLCLKPQGRERDGTPHIVQGMFTRFVWKQVVQDTASVRLLA